MHSRTDVPVNSKDPRSGLRRRRRLTGWFSARGRAIREEGQAVVEIALVMPLLLLLLTAILQFGSMYNTYESLTDAARTGARELALGRGLSDPCDLAVSTTMQSTFGDFTLPSGDVTPSFASASGGTTTSDYCGSNSGTPCSNYVYQTSCNANGAEVSGDEAKLTVSYPYTVSVFGMSIMHLTLSASAADAVE